MAVTVEELYRQASSPLKNAGSGSNAARTGAAHRLVGRTIACGASTHPGEWRAVAWPLRYTLNALALAFLGPINDVLAWPKARLRWPHGPRTTSGR
jgi:hypothetical protein